MSIRLFFIAVLCGLTLLISGPSQACETDYCYEYLMKFSARTTPAEAESILKKHSLTVVKIFESSGIYHVTSASSRPEAEILKGLNGEAGVEYAEPNYAIESNALPNDPMFDELWAMNNSGQYSGVTGVDLGMGEVWDSLTGSNSMVVAVLDSGIDYTHEDLAANMWVNADEIPNNGLDDDRNGYVDDVYGYNFHGDDGDPMDDYFHGTHVAGTIGAVGNNGVGIAGVGWRVKLMALKVLGNTGRGPLSDAIQAIDYAVRNGAKVMNNSWSFTYPGLTGLPSNPSQEPVQSLRGAIESADRNGAIFVAASGNDGVDNDTIPHYPSSYSLPNLISVTATDNKDQMPLFADYGPVSVDIGAPGVLILSTYPKWKMDPPYHFMSGTSMASPHVAGAAAMLWAAYPSLSHRQVIDYILQGAKPVASLAGKTVTGARLDLAQSFAMTEPDVNHPPVANAGPNQARKVGDTVLLRGSATDADGDSPLTFRWTFQAPSGSYARLSSVTGSQVNFLADTAGTYTATLTVSDGQSTSVPVTARIYVTRPVIPNTLPVANPGPNQLRRVGDNVLLQGRGTDADGDTLTYRWSLTAPAGSQASLRNAASATASFTPDILGTYMATLIVGDPYGMSAPVTTKIYVRSATTPPANVAPVASAGPNQLRRVGDTVLLQGSATDANGDTLTYQWSLAAPAGSRATLRNAASATASFVADVVGTYAATLVAGDGTASSAPATARVYVVLPATASSALSAEEESAEEASDAPAPLMAVIDAEKDGALASLNPDMGGLIQTGRKILLNGLDSCAGPVEEHDFEWRFIERPDGSEAQIENAGQPMADFVPDMEGRYTIELTVGDGKQVARGERSFLAVASTGDEADEEGALEADGLSGSPAAGGCSLQNHAPSRAFPAFGLAFLLGLMMTIRFSRGTLKN